MKYSVIANGTIINYDGKFKGDILIKDGKILEVANHSLGEKIQNIRMKSPDLNFDMIDAQGKYIFPGFVDAHTHPGLPEDLGFLKGKNDFYDSTFGAISGGTTLIYDFAEQGKGERLIDSVKKRNLRYLGNACCKYRFHVAVTELQDDIYKQLIEIKDRGINSIKIYTTYNMMLSNYDILRLMKYCAQLDMIVMVHCEEDSILKVCSENANYAMTRPEEAENNMVNTIINFSKVTGCKVYICHVSSAKSVTLIRNAKQDNVPVFMETCPQYMIFDDTIYNMGIPVSTKYFLSPPFRKRQDCQALIGACLDGTVDVISTDHCGFLYEKHKRPYFKDISKVAKGMPGIQLRPALMYDLLVVKNGLSLEKFVALMSYYPAKIFGAVDNYEAGYIGKGMDSDLVTCDAEESANKADDCYKISIDKIHEGSDYTPYEGMTVKGRFQTICCNC